MDEAKAKEAANILAKDMDADVLILNGDLNQESSRRFLKTVCSRKRAKNVVLVLVTSGGDPDAAFKIARCLHATYAKVTVIVSGWCKSAGTLVAIAGHELIITDEGELGPLDIQIAKSDELMELGSGLTLDAAMKSLEATASKMVVNLMVTIRRDTGGIATRTAADLAARMVTGLLEPIYRQIDPVKIGENSRAMNITRGYATRLNLHSRNLRDQRSLEFLVSAYPDHSFVIDRTESKLLFTRVSEPNDLVRSLTEALGDSALEPTPTRDGLPYVAYLSTEPSVTPEEKPADVPAKPKSPRRSRGSARPGSNGGVAPSAGGRA